MKKTFLLLCASIFLAFGFSGCSDSPDSSSEPEKGKNNGQTEAGSVTLSASNFSAWETDSASFKDNVLTLNTNKNNGKDTGNGAGFSLSNVNASAYKYAKFSYENLTLPNVTFRLSYSDGTYSETSLQTHLKDAYIELDKDRAKKITGIAFITRENANYIGEESCSFTVKGLSFVNEMELPQKSRITDKKDGTFNDSVTALEISDAMALGYSFGSGLNACPFYNNEKTKDAGFGFQNNYKDDAANNKWSIPVKMNLESQKTPLGNQAGGMAFELHEAPLVSKDFIHAVKEKGFKSIRICVTWFPHIIDDRYTIDPYFMERVRQVVDWSLQEGLYVLLNEHHSIHAYCPNPGYACGYNLTEEAKTESENYLKAIYEQICEAFNGSYDERLIFEVLNEPRVIRKKDESDTAYDLWSPRGGWGNEECMDDTGLEEPTKIMNEYNQLIVDTIRASGGNNAKRFIMVQPFATDWSTLASEYFKLPDDSANGKLMVAIHWYPLGFNKYDKKTPKENKKRDSYSDTARKAVLKAKFETVFKAAYDRFISKGVPVTITEFGIENDDCLGTFENRTHYFSSAAEDRDERCECLSDFCEAAGKYGLSAMAWDDGCVHSVVRRLPPYAAYDDEEFISAMISFWEKGKKNPYSTEAATLSGDTDLDDAAWGKKCLISGTGLSAISEGTTLKLNLSKISGANYSTIRVCPKNSSISLDMEADNFRSEPSSCAELVISGGEQPDGKGKNISLKANSAEVYYSLTSDDCTKISSAGGIEINGYGVKIQGFTLIK